MNALLDTIGPAVWRASWQAAALAVVVALIVRAFGERLSPRWRFLLWGVVLMRLLVVATPASSWSAFNLVRAMSERDDRPITLDVANPLIAPLVQRPKYDEKWVVGPTPETAAPPASLPVELPANASGIVKDESPSLYSWFNAENVGRALTWLWLTGCVLLGLKLLATALVLRRRLSACRPVTDAALLELLETTRRRIGLRRTPALLVTPECLSPCVVGTWNPRIVLPESVVTESPSERLRHVLAHELAHLVRGDLWTNWLLLAARILHWFNPVAWWTVRAMQAEREAACDELAFAALGETDRSAYAATLVELAASLAPSAIAPGLVGLFSSPFRLKARVERLLHCPSVRTLRTPVAAGVLIAVAAMGLTDAMPVAIALVPQVAGAAEKDDPNANAHTVSGRCVDDSDRSPMAGVSVRLYRIDGLASPPVEVAQTVTDADGRYAFSGLVPPRPEGHLDRLNYETLAVADGRPIGIGFINIRDGKEVVELRVAREKSTLAGKVIDGAGRPVAGASVLPIFVYGKPIPGLASATTDAEGRFRIDNLGSFKWPGGKAVATHFIVQHPDFPTTTSQANALPAEVAVTLPAGCIVTGAVTDSVTGRPAAGATITTRRTDKWGESHVAADAAGRFRVAVPEGRYDFLVAAKDRVCTAVTNRECLAGATINLPPFTLVGGGFIAGRVINTATGAPVAVSDAGDVIALGLFGPSQPRGTAISPIRLAMVDKAGWFQLRAAPGDNYPYFVNTQGERMAWNTHLQPALVVKDGETTHYDMLITPPIPPEDKLKAVRKLIAELPKKPSERTARILAEFRKLKFVDETESWCLLMREFVAIGREAVPQLCDELDRTTADGMLRRLGITLRAIGDARAVPALIRAIPRTLLPSSSDYGLIVNDQELTAFMQKHDLNPGEGGTHFDLGRPVREVIGALRVLTKQDFDDDEMLSISLSQDPRRQILQRRIYRRQTQGWQTWWEANWRTFTDDAAYQKVKLDLADEPLPPAPVAPAVGKAARVHGEWQGFVLSPAAQGGQHTTHFYDLDTGLSPKWPAAIPRVEAAHDAKPLAEWTTQRGVDLTCVTHRSPDGTETYVLRALEMKVWEIGEREVRNLNELLASGTFPEGRPVGELLMHYDPQTKQYVPDANAAFLFMTREGSLGVIEVTDRITRTADLTGTAGNPPPGVGFRKGVRFNLKAIVP